MELLRRFDHHDTMSARQQIVERAEAYANGHRIATVALKQLCHVAGVSERTLRNAFYDVRGMSPRRSMLQARLNQVREALRQGDPQATVTSVATRYGFYELGRFAQRYKAVFGEHPSQTLQATRDACRSENLSKGPRGGLAFADRRASLYRGDAGSEQTWAVGA